MKTAKIFKNGRSQAVRLPLEFRFKGNEVKISIEGNKIILSPIETSWDSMIDSLDEFSSDFLSERQEPSADKRDGFFE